MCPLIADSLSRFAPIGLEESYSKAAMLERLDNKYIIPAARLRPAFDDFADIFDVLEIGGKRAFTYARRYFDDPAQRSYYDHHRGRRKRCKVRVRTYVDADFSYLEVKLKDARDVTVKKRLKVHGSLTALNQQCMEFIDDCYADLYGEDFGSWLFPVIALEYRRIKLSLLPFLSIIDLAAFNQDAPYPALTALVMVPGVTDADFEAITEVAPGRFLMISDDEINGEKRTVIALVALGEG